MYEIFYKENVGEYVVVVVDVGRAVGSPVGKVGVFVVGDEVGSAVNGAGTDGQLP